MSTINKRKKYFVPNFEARSVLLVAALAFAAAATSHAQTAAPTMPSAAKTSAKDIDAAFMRADVNKDSKLDKKEAEMMPAISEQFDKLDTNADGALSKDEFSKAGG